MMLRSLTLALVVGSLLLPILAEAKSKAPPIPERNPKRTASTSTPKRFTSERDANQPVD